MLAILYSCDSAQNGGVAEVNIRIRGKINESKLSVNTQRVNENKPGKEIKIRYVI